MCHKLYLSHIHLIKATIPHTTHYTSYTIYIRNVFTKRSNQLADPAARATLASFSLSKPARPRLSGSNAGVVASFSLSKPAPPRLSGSGAGSAAPPSHLVPDAARRSVLAGADANQAVRRGRRGAKARPRGVRGGQRAVSKSS